MAAAVSRRPWLWGLVVLGLSAPAEAHPLAPSLLDVRETDSRQVAVTWKTSLLQPTGADLRPELPPHCTPVGDPVVTREASGVKVEWREDCGERGLVGEMLHVRGLERSRTDALVRVALRDGRTLQAVLNGRDASLRITARQARSSVVADYGRLGLEHMLTGLDHLLFVLGLVLLVAGRRALLYTVTAFTLGHSATLSLAVLGYVEFPTSWVELGIAISILVLAVELADPRGDAASRLRRRPWELAFAFGLLHGLGFAGALAEVGLPPEEIPLSLLSFNLGIEAGQLLFVIVVLGVQALFRGAIARGPSWLHDVPSYAIGSLAAFWCFERLAVLW
jgi:hydrogenase/urease accessory protein HupE